MDIWIIVIVIVCIIGIVEIITFFWVQLVRNHFPWLIIKKDEYPKLSNDVLQKFIPHGYDSELGWIRKPNTSHDEVGKDGTTTWSINSNHSRTNPGFESLDSFISCYGDSFTFSRQVNDDETWEHYLSKSLQTNVLNFGVGNHGVDQSILRLKREFPKNHTKIVVLAVVPDTISRIMSVWKHYYEYGNTFAFKPRFILENNKLKLIKNIIDDEKKFEDYLSYLSDIQKYDYFYKNKFKKEIIKFPYIFNVLKNPKRNISIIFWVSIIHLLQKIGKKTSGIDWNPMKIIMRINLKWRIKLFNNRDCTLLLQKIIEEFVIYSKEHQSIPVFLFLPQKDDILYIKKHENFYESFTKSLSTFKDLYFIDITRHIILDEKLDEFYSDNNEYGGHYSKNGNKKISTIIMNELQNYNLI